MKTHAWMLGLVAATMVAGCSRNSIEAVNLSNEGDKERGANVDGAISKYEQALQLDPSNHRIRYKLAMMYKKKEKWTEMASQLAKASEKAPTFANYFYERGLALTSAAEKGPTSWSEAKAPLEEAISKDPNIADAYYLLAETLLHLDDEAGALKNYTKAIETKPDELQYYGPLADLYMRIGKTDLAEQVLKEGLSFGKEGDKHLFAVHSLYGAVQESKGNLPGAISSYEAAKKACGQCNESGQAIAYFNLGIAYAQAKRNSEAIQQLASFDKIICKGAAATRYADQCAQSSQYGAKLNGVGQ